MKKLKPIKCKWNIMEYREMLGNCLIDKVAISIRQNEEEIKKEIEYGSSYTVTMYKQQYETIFKPLFEEISKLNQQIRELNEND